MVRTMATAQASGRPCITSPARRLRSSLADYPHDDPFQLPVRIVGSSLLVHLLPAGEDLLRACGVPHLPIRLSEQIQGSRVVRIERRGSFQLLNGLLRITTPQQRLAEFCTGTSERGIEPDGLLEGANRLCSVWLRGIDACA